MSFMSKLMGGGVPAVEVQQAAEMQNGETDALIIDVREPNEFAQVRAPGAVLIPLGQLTSRVADLPRDRELLMMCRTGGRSQSATRLLQAQGFEKVTNVSGGIVAWHRAGLPTESGAPAPGEGEL